MHEAANRDMQRLYDELERLLGDSDFFCRTYSIADIAVAPHVATAGFLGFGLDSDRHPHLLP
jgi:glutathione S-transferase